MKAIAFIEDNDLAVEYRTVIELSPLRNIESAEIIRQLVLSKNAQLTRELANGSICLKMAASLFSTKEKKTNC